MKFFVRHFRPIKSDHRSNTNEKRVKDLTAIDLLTIGYEGK